MNKKDEALKLALEYRPTMTVEVLHSWAADMKKAAQEALAEQPVQQQEPVAWWHRKSNTFTSGNLVSNFAEWTPLYTAPQPAKREPLTEDQIIEMFQDACRETFNGLERFCYFARAIEAAVWGEKT